MWQLHFGTLLFALYLNFSISIVEITNKIRTSSKLLVSKKATTSQKKPQFTEVNINFYRKQCLRIVICNKSIYWNKLYQQHKHWRKSFFQFLHFWKFASRWFSATVKKACSIFRCVWSFFLDFQRRQDQKILFMRSRFFLLHVDS